MASNSVIATQGTKNNTWMINDENAIIIDCDPIHIADKLEYYLNHRDKLKRLREAGLKYAISTNWDDETEKVYKSIIAGIKADEKNK